MALVLSLVPHLPFSLDPRIAEAKRRARRRWLVTGVILTLAAAAAVSSVLALKGSGSRRTSVVPAGVRAIVIRSAFPHARPAAIYSIMDPATVRRITGLLDALDRRGTTYGSYGLGVAGVGHNQMCPGIAGPTASLELQAADGTVLASASFVTGDGMDGLSAACNPLWFGRGQAAMPGTRFFHPQLALTGTNWWQIHFAQELQRLIGRPLCSRHVGTRAQYCKP